MKFNIQIVPYRPQYRRGAAALRSSLFGHTIAENEQYLDWKYLRNPYPEGTVLYLAVVSDEVVGMRGMFGTRWEFPTGEVVGLSQDAEVMVAPEYRRRGLYRAMDKVALARMADGGVSHMISMSANPANSAAASRLGWTKVGGYKSARRKVRGWPYGPETTGRVAGVLRRRLKWNLFPRGQFHLFDRRAKDQLPSDIYECTSHVDPGGVAEVIDRSPVPRPIHPFRSPEYLSWRFDNPLAEYRFVYSGLDPIDGYLVLAKSNPWHVWIVDMEATTTDVARELLMGAIKCSTRAAIDLWTVSLAADYSDVLAELDFRRLPPGISPAADGVFMVRPTAVGDLSLMLHGYSLKDINNWDLRMVSSDAF